MQNIFDIHDYDEGFLERFTTQTIPIYDLWSIRPLQNEQKELLAGSSEDADKFRNFIEDHSNQEFPHPLVIVIANSERNNPGRMSNTSKKYFKLKFEKFKGTDLGTPLSIAGAPQPYPTNSIPPMPFNGLNMNSSNPNNPLQGFSLGDIHGIIDRNVADATRSIKAEYQEQAALREAESIKRLAELETRMEMYKLDMRSKEVENREQELRRELEDLERKKQEGMGTVKDYTKTIAGGLFELGKSAFGIADKEPINNEVSVTKQSDLGTTSMADDNGFTETSSENSNLKKENHLDIVLQGIENLNEEQKEALLDALIPPIQTNNDDLKTTHEEKIFVEEEVIEEKQKTEEKDIKESELINQKTEENEEL